MFIKKIKTDCSNKIDEQNKIINITLSIFTMKNVKNKKKYEWYHWKWFQLKLLKILKKMLTFFVHCFNITYMCNLFRDAFNMRNLFCDVFNMRNLFHDAFNKKFFQLKIPIEKTWDMTRVAVGSDRKHHFWNRSENRRISDRF